MYISFGGSLLRTLNITSWYYWYAIDFFFCRFCLQQWTWPRRAHLSVSRNVSMFDSWTLPSSNLALDVNKPIENPWKPVVFLGEKLLMPRCFLQTIKHIANRQFLSLEHTWLLVIAYQPGKLARHSTCLPPRAKKRGQDVLDLGYFMIFNKCFPSNKRTSWFMHLTIIGCDWAETSWNNHGSAVAIATRLILEVYFKRCSWLVIPK